MITPQWIQKQDDLFDIAADIRHNVFVIEQKCDPNLEIDEFDADAIHLLAMHGDDCIGTGRIFKYNDSYHMGRICVLSEYRNMNFGYDIVKSLCDKVFKIDADTKILIHAQKYVEHFYEKFGFTSYGDIFFEENIPHIKMELTLNNYSQSNTKAYK